MVEATKDEVAVENVDAVVEADDVGGLMMTTTKEDKSHQEVVAEELRNQAPSNRRVEKKANYDKEISQQDWRLMMRPDSLVSQLVKA
ncbi:hypothetical protein A2U01_0058077 [Trifolium medium]|uniref:Uncharacterized protein n=1 Tax=Trifolium medium TaxID=97028 RepID=A0A392RLA2_9FABA|nr:hypothetical protein [Trifolium medium]